MSQEGPDSSQADAIGSPTAPALEEGSFTSKVAYRFASQVVAALSNLGVGILVARYLGAEGKGGFTLIRSAGNMALQVCTLGLPFAAMYFVGRKSCSLWLTSRLSSLVSLIIGLLIVLVLVLMPSSWLASIGFKDPEVLAGLFLILTLSAPTRAIAQNMAGALRGREYVTVPAIIQMVTLGFMQFGVAAVLLVCFSMGLMGVLYGDVARSCFSALATGYLVGVVSVRVDRGLPGPPLRQFLGYGVFLNFVQLLQTLFARLDVFILVRFAGQAAVGVYSVAMSGSELLPAFAQAVGYVLAPRVALIGDKKGAHTTLQVHRLLFWSTAIATVLLAGVAPILPYVYGPEFRSSVIPMLICLPGLSLYGIAVHVWNQFFLGSGKLLNMSLVFLTSLVAMVALDLLLIPTLGVAGAALAYSVGALVGYVVGLHLFRQGTGATFRQAFVLTAEDLRVIRGLVRRAVSRS